MRPDAPIIVLFDGECPLCRREAAYMARLDAGRGLLLTRDIAAPGFDPSRYGLTMEEVMGVIHGVLPDGRIVRELEVFRRAYALVGRGWMFAPTAWPFVKPLADRLYRWFARNRLRLTGRAEAACGPGRCGVRP